ncbi:effector-binding domain-containing protein [Rhodococcus sp. 27YEA15]|uniref:GyrI-like domain-containing protein n=1 Tax=Rhodococcus sp. 27YEA15 TaxID=3156259 RepID=UPI003C7D0221
MSEYEVVVKPVPAVRVAELTGMAASMEPLSIGPVVRGLYERLGEHLGHAGLVPVGPAIAYYEDAGDGENVVVHAALPIDAEPEREYEFVIVDLPTEAQVATLLHKGSMDHCLQTYEALARWIEEAGYRTAGPRREVTLACPEDVAGWITELQAPVTKI